MPTKPQIGLKKENEYLHIVNAKWQKKCVKLEAALQLAALEFEFIEAISHTPKHSKKYAKAASKRAREALE